jgi:ABC-2 type transport system permease protein
MSTQSNAMPESSVAQALAPVAISATRPFFWSLRRELWENRYIYIAPLATAAVILLVHSISMTRVGHIARQLQGLDPIKHREAIASHYDVAAGMLMAVQILMGVYYSLEALYAERRDRSILFWKSLPVSDTATVLSKASVPIIIIPLITTVLSITLLWIMLIVHSAIYAATGQSVSALWKELALVDVSAGLAFHLLAMHALWHAPFYGWFLLVSSWAKRAPLLWAFLPPIAVYGLEKMLFNTTHFLNLISYRLSGGPDAMDYPIHPGMHLMAWRYFISPGLWNGFLFTAICIFGAIRMRRYRGPS